MLRPDLHQHRRVGWPEPERRLVDAFRRLLPRQQQILWNALRHLASGVPGAGLMLVVDR
jgi:hypothetical protein